MACMALLSVAAMKRLDDIVSDCQPQINVPEANLPTTKVPMAKVVEKKKKTIMAAHSTTLVE